MRHNVIKRSGKYNAKKTTIDGIKFDSQKEARYYVTLKTLVKAGKVAMFLRQVPFDLGGGVKYRLDFQVFWSDGNVEFIDVKGFETAEFKIKKKLVEHLYPIEIKLI